jgi:hypothetical protein
MNTKYRRPSEYPKMKTEVSSSVTARAKSKTALGGTIRLTVSVPAAMSSRRFGAKTIGFNSNRFNASVVFEIPAGSITIARKRDIPASNHSPTFSDKTRAALLSVGTEPALIEKIEKTLPDLIARALTAAKEANETVNFDAEEYFGK